ncbi:hypothetical protein GQ457_16G012740 [Hibiscus cannabinus]
MHITVKRRTPDVDISQSTTVSGSIEYGHNPSLNIKFKRLTQRASVSGYGPNSVWVQKLVRSTNPILFNRTASETHRPQQQQHSTTNTQQGLTNTKSKTIFHKSEPKRTEGLANARTEGKAVDNGGTRGNPKGFDGVARKRWSMRQRGGRVLVARGLGNRMVGVVSLTNHRSTAVGAWSV